MRAFSVFLFAIGAACAFVQPVSAASAVKYKETELYSFKGNPDGAYPWSNVIEVNGTLYGTTWLGGNGSQQCSTPQYSCGTVFSIDLKTRTEKVLYAFCSQTGCADGANPIGGVIYRNGTLYGTTEYGGSACSGGNTCGTVFSLDLKTGVERVVFDFSGYGTPTGKNPYAGLIRGADGMLYGTTLNGGTAGEGSAFSIDPKTGAERDLYFFCSQPKCADGAYLPRGLIEVNGMLYGTTAWGGGGGCTGSIGCGTVFSLDPKSGTEKVLYSFCSQTDCADGYEPFAELISANGLLYGTTGRGGTGCRGVGCGTAFSIDPKTGEETVLYSFCRLYACKDGMDPTTSLIDVDGVLYGTTSVGGKGGCDHSTCGTFFSLDQTGGEKVLYYFCRQEKNCTDSGSPNSLLNVNGKLYGTASKGGANGNGTVFVLQEKR